MNPNTSMAVILDGFTILATLPTSSPPEEIREAREETVQSLRDLADWIEEGGFPPCRHEWPNYRLAPSLLLDFDLSPPERELE